MQQMLQTLKHHCRPSMTLYIHVSLVLERPPMGRVLQKCLTRAEQGEGSPLSACWQFLHNSVQDAFDLLCCKDTLLVHVQLAHEISQSLFCKAAFQLILSLYCWMGLFFLRGGTWHLYLLSFMRFLFTRFFSLSGSLWVAAQPPGVSDTPSSFVPPSRHASSLSLTHYHKFVLLEC